MSYEHSLSDGKMVRFPDEENYLKCKIGYLEYANQFTDGEDHLSFYGYIDSHKDDLMDWHVEDILLPNEPYTHSMSFSFDATGDLVMDENINSIVGLDGHQNPFTIANISYTTDADPAASNDMSNELVMDADGTVLYSTLIPNTSETTNLNNGWVRTNATYSCSTESPEQKDKRLKEEEERKRSNQFNRFDILDF